jgi:MFS family permease
VFFFASIYGQVALAEKATTASLLILYFFLGFVVCAQIGGRMLDRIGAKRPVVLGCALAAVGFGLWASRATDLHVGAQVIYIVMAIRDVLFGMCVIMVIAGLVALRGSGRESSRRPTRPPRLPVPGCPARDRTPTSTRSESW